MQVNSDAIFDAALTLPESEQLALLSRLIEAIPVENVTMSVDDPGLKEELDRRINDGSDPIPWSDVRAE